MPQSNAPAIAESDSRSGAITWKRAISVVFGALLVALAAQVSVTLPGSPVPVTLQGLAVLLVGGVLGAGGGAAALVLYLLAGVAGLPVFAPIGVPLVGFARLLGPTGGYLLAFPVAAALVGALARRHDLARCLLACLLGMVVIHVGGVAQLAILTGGAAVPFKATAPLIVADITKVVLAALLVSRLRAGTPSRT
jgi:biotin transport system substrate-specific component